MNWVASLCALYDANAERAGKAEKWKGKPLVLFPVGYDTMEAQIEIHIDQEGNYMGARVLEKEEAETLAPYPESRTSGPKALPLFDSLAYVAGDLLEAVTFYFSDAKNEKERQRKLARLKESFPRYLAGLKAWCESPFSHPKVRAIYRYVAKQTVAGDLIRSQVLGADENGIVSDKVKVQKTSLDKAFVRFRVFMNDELLPEDILGDPNNAHDSAVWLDRTVQNSFIDYYLSTFQTTDLCYMTGEHTPRAKTHPLKIRGKWDTKAKLISANDDTNFTYRGRFITKEKDTGYNEALSIGYVTSQKAHNALKWIIRRQGFSRDGVCIVAWENALRDLPDFYASAADILSRVTENAEDEAEFETEEEILLEEDEGEIPETNYASAAKFNAALDGYASKLSGISKMVVLALDSATPGRLAMTYYKELESSRYLKNLHQWHDSCAWKHEYIQDKKLKVYEGMASLREIALAVYGTEQGEDNNPQLKLSKNSDNKAPMLADVFERLRPCIIEGGAIPRDMVRAAVLKASNPLAYKGKFNYNKVLHIACSLVKRLYWEKQQRMESEGVILRMELDKTNRDRSYLYGRILAVAERVERATYEKGETRTTNAERYMQAFSRSPFRTWNTIWNNLQPYLKQLKPAAREYYKNLLGEITGLFEYKDRISNEFLDGKYLIGYDCQRTDLKRWPKEQPAPEGGHSSPEGTDEDHNNEEGEERR
ncbi:CRISPR-associated protein Cas8c/Csd1, subtype I-C/DVULG [Desulfosporosinus orientis DSM 765]|uniref:CRISPR-associated protein Cas8c/Csd1, subtype I-C/DVULG n=1 Tax=Desulfosporosinus orientis (strain ATCC 19365 / DSM 765 / NCIMB 8382 / VKM B-1628 / Singapore I) TaxID=768706 RepID=G7W8L5_DESOD|nr:type I-C CRISPR-associated protein Cas8c/Csd1 [Desulfosporosinus orientis]AET67442.1 CRISPR-associated protein Cas8c/Csd1, subtype I-C/DVULG [Desulfosporosinus orientis DSM 765]